MHPFRAKIKKIAFVGGFDLAHIGRSLVRAAAQLDIDTVTFDIAEASHGNRLLRTLSWRFGDRRPLQMNRFSEQLVGACTATRPDLLIATGAVPLPKEALRALHALNVICINYSTDDPWNPISRAQWFLDALPSYHVIFTPRRANVDDFRRLGCSDVRYLPFGYDDVLHARSDGRVDAPNCDVLFVGGADRDRVAFATAFMRGGSSLALVGSYWERFWFTRRYALGCKPPETIRELTAAAKVNLCLVRRANRDGHVMRSFEIAAIGGCMLAEDTAEHREIFGSDGEAVVYFRTPDQAAARARMLIADPNERARLAAAVRARVVGGHNSYRDRLAAMLASAA